MVGLVPMTRQATTRRPTSAVDGTARHTLTQRKHSHRDRSFLCEHTTQRAAELLMAIGNQG